MEHEKRNSIFTSNHVLFFLFYEHTNDDVFDDFPRIFEVLKYYSEGQKNVSDHYLKIAEDDRRSSENVSIVHHGQQI